MLNALSITAIHIKIDLLLVEEGRCSSPENGIAPQCETSVSSYFRISSAALF
jgi:hypothetical protein